MPHPLQPIYCTQLCCIIAVHFVIQLRSD